MKCLKSKSDVSASYPIVYNTDFMKRERFLISVEKCCITLSTVTIITNTDTIMRTDTACHH